MFQVRTLKIASPFQISLTGLEARVTSCFSSCSANSDQQCPSYSPICISFAGVVCLIGLRSSARLPLPLCFSSEALEAPCCSYKAELPPYLVTSYRADLCYFYFQYSSVTATKHDNPPSPTKAHNLPSLTTLSIITLSLAIIHTTTAAAATANNPPQTKIQTPTSHPPPPPNLQLPPLTPAGFLPLPTLNSPQPLQPEDRSPRTQPLLPPQQILHPPPRSRRLLHPQEWLWLGTAR